MLINTCRYSLTLDNETWKDKIWKKKHIQDIETNLKRNVKSHLRKRPIQKIYIKLRTTILKEPNGTLITDKSEVDEIFRDMFEKSMF